MLRNRYLIAALCMLLLGVLGWNISFFAGRRTARGRQTGVIPSEISSASDADRQGPGVAARKVFPVGRDAAVWRRDPFTFSLRASAEKKPVVVPGTVIDDGIDLQGIMTSGGKRFALVNGRAVGVGDRVRDNSVIAINQYSIVLKGDRGTREVSIIHETVKEK
ncbi:MAG: hypothetical protein WA610_08580 [Thermodesulfovibrionales bacterium]